MRDRRRFTGTPLAGTPRLAVVDELPGGHTITTHPPAYGTDAQLPPAGTTSPAEPPAEPTSRPVSTLELLRTWTPDRYLSRPGDRPPPF